MRPPSDQVLETGKQLPQASLEEAEIYYDLDEGDRAIEMVGKAEEHRELLDGNAKLKLDALKLELVDDSEGATGQYDVLIKSYPKDIDGLYFFASAAMQQPERRNEAERALEACLRLDKLNPDCNVARLDLWIYENRFDEVRHAYDSLHTKLGDYPWLEEPMAVALWGLDDISGAQAHLAVLEGATAGGIKVHGRAHKIRAQEWSAEIDRYQGKFDAARQSFRKLAEKAVTPQTKASELIESVRAEALMGLSAQVKSTIEVATHIAADTTTLEDATAVLAMIGASKEAHDTLAKLKASRNGKEPINASFDHFVEGSLLLAHSQAANAIEELKQATKTDEGYPDFEARYLLARAYMDTGQWQDAAQQLTSIAEQKGPVLMDEVGSMWPLSHYDLARCYEKMGRNKEATENYQVFLDLWKASDPGLKQIVTARQWSKAQAARLPR